METPCTCCGQTSTDQSYWGDESIAEIQKRNGWKVEPMQFGDCDECKTLHVCPDCLHERHCCEALQEAGD